MESTNYFRKQENLRSEKRRLDYQLTILQNQHSLIDVSLHIVKVNRTGDEEGINVEEETELECEL